MKGRGRGSLTRLRPIKSVTLPFTRAAIRPPTVNAELKSEYCNTKIWENVKTSFDPLYISPFDVTDTDVTFGWSTKSNEFYFTPTNPISWYIDGNQLA